MVDQQPIKIELHVGRPKEVAIKNTVLALFDEMQYGTIRKIQQEASKKYGRNISWNTVQKYLEELVKEDRIVKKVVKLKNESNPNSLERIIYHVKGLNLE